MPAFGRHAQGLQKKTIMEKSVQDLRGFAAQLSLGINFHVPNPMVTGHATVPEPVDKLEKQVKDR